MALKELDERWIDIIISMFKELKDFLTLILISCSKWIEVMWIIWIALKTSCMT